MGVGYEDSWGWRYPSVGCAVEFWGGAVAVELESYVEDIAIKEVLEAPVDPFITGVKATVHACY